MSVDMASFSNRFLDYDVINVIITEIRLLCSNKQNWHVIFSNFKYAPTSDLIFVTIDVKSVLRLIFVYQKFLDRGWGNRNIDNDKCAKMPIFSYMYIRRLNTCVCMQFIQTMNVWYIYTVRTSSKYSHNKNWFIILISNRASFDVRGSGSLLL